MQLIDLSIAQDIEAGDGTTSVVVLAGSLLGAAERLLQTGIHPTVVAEAFLRASVKAAEYLSDISIPVNLNDRANLLRAASTSLNSKVSLMAVLYDEAFLTIPTGCVKQLAITCIHSCRCRGLLDDTGGS